MKETTPQDALRNIMANLTLTTAGLSVCHSQWHHTVRWLVAERNDATGSRRCNKTSLPWASDRLRTVAG